MMYNNSSFTAPGTRNIFLLIGCLFIANVLFIMSFFYSEKWIQKEALGLRKNAFAQKILLEKIIYGYEKGRVIEMLKKEIGKPEDINKKLRIDDKIIIFGETEIILRDGKVDAVKIPTFLGEKDLSNSNIQEP